MVKSCGKVSEQNKDTASLKTLRVLEDISSSLLKSISFSLLIYLLSHVVSAPREWKVPTWLVSGRRRLACIAQPSCIFFCWERATLRSTHSTLLLQGWSICLIMGISIQKRTCSQMKVTFSYVIFINKKENILGHHRSYFSVVQNYGR